MSVNNANCWTNTGSRARPSITFSWYKKPLFSIPCVFFLFKQGSEATRRASATSRWCRLLNKDLIVFFVIIMNTVPLLRGWPALNKFTTYRYCTGVGKKKSYQRADTKYRSQTAIKLLANLVSFRLSKLLDPLSYSDGRRFHICLNGVDDLALKWDELMPRQREHA